MYVLCMYVSYVCITSHELLRDAHLHRLDIINIYNIHKDIKSLFQGE